MIYLVNTIFILLCGLWDRYRGDDDYGFKTKDEPGRSGGKTVDAFVEGSCALALLTQYQLHIIDDFKTYLYFGLSFAAARGMAYAGPWGAITAERKMYEGSRGWSWWQRGILQENKHLAMSFRASLGGVVMLPVCHYLDNFHPALAVYMGLQFAPYLSPEIRMNEAVQRLLYDHANIGKPGKDQWNLAEFLCGCIIGIVCLMGSR